MTGAARLSREWDVNVCVEVSLLKFTIGRGTSDTDAVRAWHNAKVVAAVMET